jgi:hypothetical protein
MTKPKPRIPLPPKIQEIVEQDRWHEHKIASNFIDWTLDIDGWPLVIVVTSDIKGFSIEYRTAVSCGEDYDDTNDPIRVAPDAIGLCFGQVWKLEMALADSDKTHFLGWVTDKK